MYSKEDIVLAELVDKMLVNVNYIYYTLRMIRKLCLNNHVDEFPKQLDYQTKHHQIELHNLFYYDVNNLEDKTTELYRVVREIVYCNGQLTDASTSNRWRWDPKLAKIQGRLSCLLIEYLDLIIAEDDPAERERHAAFLERCHIAIKTLLMLFSMIAKRNNIPALFHYDSGIQGEDA